MPADDNELRDEDRILHYGLYGFVGIPVLSHVSVQGDILETEDRVEA